MSNRNKKILIDALYPKEVRVAVIQDGQLIDFDQEAKDKKQLKGNIYCAIVSRIEPSLQAIFIEYGLSRHGFLPFSEISLGNYQISEQEESPLAKLDDEEALPLLTGESLLDSQKAKNDDSSELANNDETITVYPPTKETNKSYESHSRNSYKNIRVQDVINVGQSIIVQIIKEERGNKCATFSTYITLVGRYCVFMPNSGNKKTVSRRIEDAENRKNLKDILSSIDLPENSGVIVRTAGENKKTKDIEHDLSYLQSLWNNIQDTAKDVTNPTLLYVEGDIIKRTLRDLYDDSTEEIIISGNQACESAKECAKLIFQNKLHIRLYRRNMSLFLYYKIEEQIQQLYGNVIKLPSGGYIVIDSTEALIAIDINSGKMTGEDSIEETAYKTNMEATKEIARHVNLRGLSGLIVIDFIDMIKFRYCRAIECALKEAFKYDRAKVQFGHISPFGLMEISRQRVKQSILEINSSECIHCRGTGRSFSPRFVASSLLRQVIHLASKNHSRYLIMNVSESMMIYFFNNEKTTLSDIEKEYGVIVKIKLNNDFLEKDFYIEVGEKIDKHECSDEGVVNFFTKSYKVKKRCEFIKKVLDKASSSNFWIKKWLNRILNMHN